MKDLPLGFQLLAAYTFSKSIDDAADSLGTPLGGSFGRPILGQVVYNDQNNVRAQRGVSDFDRTHRLVISGTWAVPTPGHATSAAVQKLGNGWSISGIVTLQSGLPFSILDSAAGTLFSPATLVTTGSPAPAEQGCGTKHRTRCAD